MIQVGQVNLAAVGILEPGETVQRIDHKGMADLGEISVGEFGAIEEGCIEQGIIHPPDQRLDWWIPLIPAVGVGDLGKPRTGAGDVESDRLAVFVAVRHREREDGDPLRELNRPGEFPQLDVLCCD